ncbi:MAG: hypothetical protein QXS19_07370 [Candidatus Methanomethylicia archaeon]
MNDFFIKILVFLVIFSTFYSQDLSIFFNQSVLLDINEHSSHKLFRLKEKPNQGFGFYVGGLYRTKRRAYNKNKNSNFLGLELSHERKHRSLLDSVLHFNTNVNTSNLFIMLNILREGNQEIYFKIGTGLMFLDTFYDNGGDKYSLNKTVHFFCNIGFLNMFSIHNDLSIPIGFNAYLYLDDNNRIDLLSFSFMYFGISYRIFKKEQSACRTNCKR